MAAEVTRFIGFEQAMRVCGSPPNANDNAGVLDPSQAVAGFANEGVVTVALLPIGFPAEGAHYGPTRSRPLEEVAFNERWGKNWQDHSSVQS